MPSIANVLHQLHYGSQGLTNGGTDTHLTPHWIIDLLHSLFSAGYLDPCASHLNPDHTRALHFYTQEDDGLSRLWAMDAFVNPPFSEVSKWVDKAAQSNVEVLFLAKFDPRTAWCRRLIGIAASSRVIHGYTKFLDTNGNEGGSAMFQIGLYFLSNSISNTAHFDRLFSDRSYKVLPS